MADMYLKSLQSRPFKFLVGDNAAPVFLHRSLVAHHSDPLRVLIDGPMIESKLSSAKLPDTDKETFLRFGQYIYTNAYDEILPQKNDPSPQIGSGEMTATPDSAVLSLTIPIDVTSKLQEEEIDKPLDIVDTIGSAWGYAPIPHSLPKRNKKIKKAALSPSLLLEKQEEEEVEISMAKKSKSRGEGSLWDRFLVRLSSDFEHTARINSDASENYTEVFPCHARLHVFADKYCIPLLAEMALIKLHRALSKFTLHSERVGDVVHLTEYCYDNCPQESEIVNIVLHYAACKIEILSKNAEFRELLSNGGPLVNDIMTYVIKRVEN